MDVDCSTTTTSSDESDDETPTMVITLGCRSIKAAYSGQKTCRYVSDKVHIRSNGSDDTRVEPGLGTVPLLDTVTCTISNRAVLVSALLSCWSEQYTDNFQPHETRLALVVSIRRENLLPSRVSKTLLEELGEIAFEELGVLELCVMTPGEAVSVYEAKPTCAVLDIGYFSSIIEVFVNWVRVERIELLRGAYNVEESSTKNSDVIFQKDPFGKNIPVILQGVLERFESVSTVIVVGSPSFSFSAADMSEHCGTGNKCSYRLAPERNKSSWLGASIVPEISSCQHRFYTKAEWKLRPEYEPLFIPQLPASPSS